MWKEDWWKMMCPNRYCTAELIELSIDSKDYKRGMTYKCMLCQKFFTIVQEDFKWDAVIAIDE